MRLILVSLGVILVGITNSCIERDNHGYPSAVYFPAEGGTKIINGNYPISHIEIVDYKTGDSPAYANSHYPSSELPDGQPLSLKYQWLELYQDYNSTQLEITVDPSEGGKKRKFNLEGYFGQSYAEIEIIQNPE